MRLSRYRHESDGSIPAEMIMAGVAFVLLAVMVADYAVSQRTAPVAVLHTEPEPPRLILSE